jgi:hypothetical protein
LYNTHIDTFKKKKKNNVLEVSCKISSDVMEHDLEIDGMMGCNSRQIS